MKTLIWTAEREGGGGYEGGSGRENLRARGNLRARIAFLSSSAHPELEPQNRTSNVKQHLRYLYRMYNTQVQLDVGSHMRVPST